ncbi:MAG: T9SS type A sorting domain-containing protein [Saprospiraceae bacterium]|nr:T9SS type A sorting domain-containing protein [Saprospiraceae bacterium]
MKGGIPKPEKYDTASGSNLKILQNPIMGRTLSFEVLNVTDAQLNFDLYSTSGYKVWSDTASLIQPGGVFEYQLPNLPQGLYILCVNGSYTNLRTKIIIGQ